MRIAHGFVFAFSWVGFASVAAAFPQHVDNIPNGNLTPPTGQANCQLCHNARGGGEGWNVFGQQFLIQGGANPAANPNNQNSGYAGEPSWDADICGDDADGDGYTNGDELGDPDCVWTVGAAEDFPDITHPGNADSFPGAAEGEGEGGTEGEGEGDVVGCSSTEDSGTTLALLGAFTLPVAVVARVSRRRR